MRVQVGLGGDHHAHRADLVGLPDEPHLRFGELLAGVADHQHRVGVGQQAQRRGQVRLAVPAHPGGVDESQAALEQRAGRADFDAQHLAAAGLRRAPQIVLDVVDRDRDDLGFAAAGGRGHHQPGRWLLAVGDDGDQRGGLVVPDAGHRHVQQRVQQLALALLELTGDDHPDLRIADPLPRDGQALAQVGAVVELRDGAGVVDQFDDHLHPARVRRLVGRRAVGLCHRFSLASCPP